jgi:hypothetical protein
MTPLLHTNMTPLLRNVLGTLHILQIATRQVDFQLTTERATYADEFLSDEFLSELHSVLDTSIRMLLFALGRTEGPSLDYYVDKDKLPAFLGRLSPPFIFNPLENNQGDFQAHDVNLNNIMPVDSSKKSLVSDKMFIDLLPRALDALSECSEFLPAHKHQSKTVGELRNRINQIFMSASDFLSTSE